jgi:hypothetical protein
MPGWLITTLLVTAGVILYLIIGFIVMLVMLPSLWRDVLTDPLLSTPGKQRAVRDHTMLFWFGWPIVLLLSPVVGLTTLYEKAVAWACRKAEKDLASRSSASETEEEC